MLPRAARTLGAPRRGQAFAGNDHEAGGRAGLGEALRISFSAAALKVMPIILAPGVDFNTHCAAFDGPLAVFDEGRGGGVAAGGEGLGYGGADGVDVVCSVWRLCGQGGISAGAGPFVAGLDSGG